MPGTQRTKAYLETRFETGDKPTQGDFADLIWSLQAQLVSGGGIVLEPQVDGTILVRTDLPDSLPPSGVAGGDLEGTYPNPVIGTEKIKTTNLAPSSVTLPKIAPGTKLASPNALTLVVNGTTSTYDGSSNRTVTFNSGISGGVGIPTVQVKAVSENFHLGQGKTSTLYPAENQIADTHLDIRFGASLEELRALAADGWSVGFVKYKKRVGENKQRQWGVVKSLTDSGAIGYYPDIYTGFPAGDFVETRGVSYWYPRSIQPVDLSVIVNTDYKGAWYRLPYTAESLIRRFFYVKEARDAALTYTIRPMSMYFRHSLHPNTESTYTPPGDGSVYLCSPSKRRYDQIWGKNGDSSGDRTWTDLEAGVIKKKSISEWFGVALVKYVQEQNGNPYNRWLIGPFTPFQAIMNMNTILQTTDLYHYGIKMAGIPKVITNFSSK
jgi:hypothetical protein